MAVSLSKRRSSRAAKDHVKSTRSSYCLCTNILCSVLYRVPSAILLLILIFIWSSSTTIISGNIVHVCVSSRKLNNLYCLSAGAQSHPSSFELPIPAFDGSININSTTSTPTTTTTTEVVNVESDRSEVVVRDIVPVSFVDQKSSTAEIITNETEDAMQAVKDQLEVQRSWISHSTNRLKCEQRGIFVYDLPSKFNKDLMVQCGNTVPGLNNLCKYLENDALGEAEPELGTRWFRTHQYTLEPIFHSRVLKHPCRVYNEEEAKLFYVPYYGGLEILRWHFKNDFGTFNNSLSGELVDWLGQQKAWTRNQGKDHVFLLGKVSWDFRRNSLNKWGTRFLELEQMQKPVKLLIERQPWNLNEVGIPYPTGFHPHSDDDVIAWQQKIIGSWRKNTVSFVGAARPGDSKNIRSELINQCTSDKDCFFHDCRSGGCDRPVTVTTIFMESEFCLQPPGDTPTRKSLFDSLISGCIPVLFDPFTAYYQYSWHLPEDISKYSVFIDQEEVREMKVDVVEMLRKITKQEREEMRSYIVYELMPGLVYGDSSSELKRFQDAFSITMNNILERVSRL